MKYKKTGLTQIENGLQLNNPFFEVVKITLDINSNEFEVEVHFYESFYRHSRSYKGITENNTINNNVIANFINSHELLSQFEIDG